MSAPAGLGRAGYRRGREYGPRADAGLAGPFPETTIGRPGTPVTVRQGGPGTAQMLYRFDGAATAAAIGAAVSAALPAGAVTGTRSYLTVKAADTARVAAYVPVLIASGLAGLVLALLTVGTVIRRAVTAGSTRIRILKVIGFSPGQVAAAYAGQGLVPAAAGCLGGVLVGNLLARPLLAGAAYSFGPGALGVPAWVDVDVTVVMFGLTALAALASARRLTRVP